jgi:hypothetical protein
MNLRDFIAIMAMQGKLSAGATYPITLSVDSYKIADAMLKERSRDPA